MRRITITETDAGQWIAETSGGTRASGASLESVLNKLLPSSAGATDLELDVLVNVFAGIRPTSNSQIVSGQAGA